MENVSMQAIVLYFATIILWMLVIGVIWLSGRRCERVRDFHNRMWEGWRPALAITVFYLVSVLFSGRGINPYGIVVFCQALIGLALAKGIPNFEPLPLLNAILRRERMANQLLLLAVFGTLAGVIGIALGGVAMSISQNLFHETILTNEIMQTFPGNKVQAFFLFLSGGGIAEEIMFRLLLLTFLLSITQQPWPAIFLAAIISSTTTSPPLICCI
jgi:membrane protease YdiL (CAAX protease family)